MEKPILSIIVPGYNVEDYIDDCLQTIVNQSFTEYEVILIDDESPDNTGVIMDQYAEKYDNFRVIHKINEGISVARNIGIKESRGEYIAFVDSDDLLSPSAYQQLVGSLEKTHSDIAVGGVKRFNSKKNVYSFLHRKAILDGMNQTSILKHPELVYDTTVWNKVFKKSLLIDNDILFPEGVIYEDIPFTLEAHLNAKSIDIIDHIVYYWRWREGENLSWTQQRNDLELYNQRLASIKNGLDIINKYHAEQLIIPFFKKAYEVDIPLFIPDPKFGDLTYAVEFQKISYRFIKEVGEEYIDLVRPDKQVRLRALMNGDIDTMIGYVAHNTRGQKITYQDGHLRFENDYIKDRPWLNQVRLEESVPFNSKILSVKKAGSLCYNINGVSYARYTQNIKHDNNNYTVELQKVEGNENEKIPLAFEEEKTNFVKGFLGKKTTVGISVKIDFEKIANQLTEGTWKIQVTDEMSELKSWGFLGNPKKKVKKIPSFVLGKHLIKAKYNNNWELSFIVQKIENEVVTSTLKEDCVLVRGNFSLQAHTAALKLNGSEETVFASKTEEENQACFQFKLGKELPYGDYKFKLYDYLDNELTYVVTSSFNDENQEDLVLINRFAKNNINTLTFKYFEAIGRISEWKINGERIHFTLYTEPAISAKEFSLRFISKNKENKFVFSPEYREQGNLVFSIPLRKNNDFVFTPGKYIVYLDAIDDNVTSYKVYGPSNVRETQQFEDQIFRIRVWFTKKGELRLTSRQFWGKLDNSKKKRGVNYSLVYPLMRFLPIKNNVVVYDSFWSTKFNDSPKAMYEYLYNNYPNLQHVWILKKMNTPTEGPAIKVRKNSLKYWYYMARAKYFIENTNLPDQYAKRKKQVEVQTFHGTFMKTMGFDEPYFKNGSKKRQNNFERRNKRWDLAISPSKYMTNKIRSAFNYEGEIIETGFPRNDDIYLNNHSDYINKVKSNLGISYDKKVILYAPTYRNKGSFDLDLDLSLMREKLGDDYVILVRLHYFVANNINIQNFAPFALDVSNYEDINDLYVISDALVTDYSSVMFDFAHLERPMLFFAYDYEDYVNDSRGVYLDYSEVVPGPIVTTTVELIEELQQIERLKNNYYEKIHQFYLDFCEFGRNADASKISSEAMLDKESDYIGEPLIRNKIKKAVRFRRWYPRLLEHEGKKKKKKLIVFESFFGRNYSDNPKAMYEYMKKNHPEYKCVWNVNRDYLDYFKEHKIPHVVRFSVRSALIIARAKFWIINTRLPLWLKKPQGTTVIQTWHGTPLKTLGRDVSLLTMPGMTVEKYHNNVVKDSDKWDYCLSPNSYSTDIFKQAFRLRPEQMINSGYPRNDVLHNHTESYANDLKEKLGIAKDRKVILYAPTWRDNEYVRSDYYTAKLHLDLKEMQKRFGNQAVLLVRTHYLIANNLNLNENDFAIDVSDYQDINDLYIVSDLLITDYSSVFFDYANLKKPMIFYAYDLEEYAGEIRGFYFDYVEEAPGPILTQEEQVYQEIEKQLETPQLANNYEQFVKKYCSWDDGNATQRALSFILNQQSYLVRELPFEKETLSVVNDIVIFSDVIGHGNYDIVKNVLAAGQAMNVLKKAILVDPIQGNDTGEPCYYVESNDFKGWINTKDFLTLKKENS
ncbi:CDP-glycerol glycerophosphotransferase family protein [Tetragenococcus halophilus]|uniref:CDP-glycerol glycerophosphotransferase family protein n=1 Tax=Tetragenococcus halophilus TaxID=51669 RepID=UPI002A9904E1|nr:hypothetical protein TEHSL10_00930 [Tetragenococcus halophilus]